MLFQETEFQRDGNQLDLVRIKESENRMLKKQYVIVVCVLESTESTSKVELSL